MRGRGIALYSEYQVPPYFFSYSADRHFNAQRQAQLEDDSVALEQREREMHQLEVRSSQYCGQSVLSNI